MIHSDKLNNDIKNKTRVVVFGSFHRGYHILKNLLEDTELQKHIEVVGVVTDDPDKGYTNAKNRVWRYSDNEDDKYMVENLAKAHGIPVHKGRIKPPANAENEHGAQEGENFRKLLKEEWKPDIIYMGTFGQRIDEEIFNTPAMGMYNLHPSDDSSWPSCVGPDPFEQLFAKHKEDPSKGNNALIVLHEVDEKFDNGQMAACSDRIPVPYKDMDALSEGEKVVAMHRLTSPHAGILVNTHLRSQLDLPLSKKRDIHQEPYTSKRSTKLEPDQLLRRNKDDGWLRLP